ncbi:MAG TPA: hypothetical protein VIU40_14395 [Geobacteraceae bacterium]
MTRLRLLISCLLLISFAGCSGENREAQRLVRAYNDAVIQAYRSGDTGRLADVAGDRELRIITTLLDVKRSAGLVLEATLESLQVTGVEKAGAGDMTVETQERWSYQDRSLAPGAPPGRLIRADMAMRYSCAREGGKWKVIRVATVSNTVEGGGEGKKQ